jgi:hypothetical protein
MSPRPMLYKKSISSPYSSSFFSTFAYFLVTLSFNFYYGSAEADSYFVSFYLLDDLLALSQRFILILIILDGSFFSSEIIWSSFCGVRSTWFCFIFIGPFCSIAVTFGGLCVVKALSVPIPLRGEGGMNFL